jgi:predicted permease
MNTALLLLPDFALILLGTAIRRWMHLGDHFWSGVEKLVYFILFRRCSSTPSSRPGWISARHCRCSPRRLPQWPAAWCWVLCQSCSRLPALTYASMFQCAYRFNSYIALAVAGMLFGSPGIATMGLIVGAAVPVVNLVSVWMLARHGEVGCCARWRAIH